MALSTVSAVQLVIEPYVVTKIPAAPPDLQGRVWVRVQCADDPEPTWVAPEPEA